MKDRQYTYRTKAMLTKIDDLEIKVLKLEKQCAETLAPVIQLAPVVEPSTKVENNVVEVDDDLIEDDQE